MKKQKIYFAIGLLLLSLTLFISWRKVEKPETIAAGRTLPITMCGSFFPSLEDTVFLPVRLLSGLGDLHYAITTQDPQVQKFFDQGLRLIYRFHILKGELLMKQNKLDDALKALNSAVLAEDTMRYNEPPDWRLPARHFLGGAMLEAGRYADAEKVFIDDLNKNPENGWALQGLM